MRPTGHPYDRQLELSPQLCEWVGRFGRFGRSRDAGFLIVDEGPGISSSSFLAVAEGLSAGAASKASAFIWSGSRVVDPAGFAGHERRRALDTLPLPCHAKRAVCLQRARERVSPEASGAGIFTARRAPCPPRGRRWSLAKFLGRDQRSIFKFEGFGHYGEAIGERAKLLAECGFSPALSR